MDLQTKIEQDLWAGIETAYQSGQFTSAIIDAMHFVSKTIRERTGFESDGVALVGQAFGGDSPMLKVNKLQTESDRNIQKGTESLLRGLYQAIRNPRSHDKYVDNKNDADALIFFINYLIRMIKQSTPPFSKSDFLERVFDKHFVQQERYVQLLVETVPTKQQLDILIEVYRRKDEGEIDKLKLFVPQLLKRLTGEEHDSFCEVVSEEMRTTNDDSSMRRTIQLLPTITWVKIKEDSRLRIENRFLQSVIKGIYDKAAKRCIDGALGTWFNDRIEASLLKREFISALLNKIDANNNYERAYVYHFFLLPLLSLVSDSDGFTQSRAEKIVLKALSRRDTEVYEALTEKMKQEDHPWFEAFREAYENYPPPSDDEIPF